MTRKSIYYGQETTQYGAATGAKVETYFYLLTEKEAKEKGLRKADLKTTRRVLNDPYALALADANADELKASA